MWSIKDLNIIIYVLALWNSAHSNETLLKNEETNIKYLKEKYDFKNYCEKNYNLTVIPKCDSNRKTISITFFPSTEEIKECFKYFYLFLEEQRKQYVPAFVTLKNDTGFCEFKNLSSGTYQLMIEPCYSEDYTWDTCTGIHIVVTNLVLSDKSILTSQPLSSSNEHYSIIVIAAFVGVSIFVVISIICLIKPTKGSYTSKTEPALEKDSLSSSELHKSSRTVHVYILHSYETQTTKKIDVLKEFLESSCNFKVSMIGDEMFEILNDPNSWLSNIMEYKCSDSGDRCRCNRRIIIAQPSTLCDDDNVKENELERKVFAEFIKRMKLDWNRAFKDYRHLFIVQFSDSVTNTELKNIVPRDRYIVPEHLIDLCLNLSSDADLEKSALEEKLMLLLKTQPIKNMCDQM